MKAVLQDRQLTHRAQLRTSAGRSEMPDSSMKTISTRIVKTGQGHTRERVHNPRHC